jgi:hypothetical protein
MFASHLPPESLPISKNHDPFKIAGVDMRSEAGRRFRDLAALVIAEHLPHVDPVKVRELRWTAILVVGELEGQFDVGHRLRTITFFGHLGCILALGCGASDPTNSLDPSAGWSRRS